MLISNILDGSFGLISKQLHFYCHRFRRRIGAYQKQEIIELVVEQRYDQLVKHIATLCQNNIWDHKQQVAKLLIEHCYLRTSRRQLLFKLIQNKLIDIDVRLDSYGRTLLHRSAYNLDVELVKVLTENNVGVRLRDYAGNTALHIAIQSYRNGALLSETGHMVKKNLCSIIKLLLEADRAEIKHILCNHRNSSLVKSDANNNNRHDRNLTENSKHFRDGHAFSTYEVHEKTSEALHLPDLSIPLRSKDHGGISFKQADLFPCISRMPRNIKLEEHYESSELTFNKLFQNSDQLEGPNRVELIMLPDYTTSMVNTKNAFGRTALHYCVLLIGEKHLTHFVELLLDYGADPNATDAKMKTPFYCLMKRPDMTDISFKRTSMCMLLANDCDDLGLALTADHYLLKSSTRTSPPQQRGNDNNNEFINDPVVDRHGGGADGSAITLHNDKFKRVPNLKHLARLSFVRNKKLFNHIPKNQLPSSLLTYLERRLIDQSEFM